MENLSLNEVPPPPGAFAPPGGPGGPGGPGPDEQHMPPPVPQLPPQMFTTAAQLLDLTDKKLMVALRDGRKLIGVLRSWDQFGNVVLQDTHERLYTTSPRKLFASIPRGVFLIRGENVLLLGEIDLDKEDDIPEGYEEAPANEVFELQKAEKEERRRREKVRQKRLQALGFDAEQGLADAII